jgi:hypothetical protein
MAGIMLVAFASRGLIPAGFMPASDRPFSLEICWDGLPAGMLAQLGRAHADSMGMESMGMDMPADSMAANPGHSTSHGGLPQGPHHHGSPSQSDHCVFGSACSAGPIPHQPLPSEFSSTRQPRAAAVASIAADVHLVHLPQPRAPPLRLS